MFTPSNHFYNLPSHLTSKYHIWKNEPRAYERKMQIQFYAISPTVIEVLGNRVVFFLSQQVEASFTYIYKYRCPISLEQAETPAEHK